MATVDQDTLRVTAPVVIIHGGAWQIPESQTAATLAGVKEAARIAHAALRESESSSALQAVELAVRHLESDPVFDAGLGSCLTNTGIVEMDAAIMSDQPALGAVAAISNVHHPVSAARAVLESEHALLVSTGANTFAKESGLPCVDASQLVTEAARREWKSYGQYGHVVHDLFNSGHDTVGAVALDVHGRIACATSTGGITYKREGRVGDSPVVGAGLYCQRDVGGVSATGHGESILQTVLCKHLIDLMHMRGASVADAAVEALQVMHAQTAGSGGVVALDVDGRWAAECTTNRMAWACVDRDAILHAGVDKDESINYGKIDECNDKK